MTGGNVKRYVLKTPPELIDADPVVIDRLTRFVNYALRIDGEMTKALEARIYGKHEGGTDEPGIDDGGRGIANTPKA